MRATLRGLEPAAGRPRPVLCKKRLATLLVLLAAAACGGSAFGPGERADVLDPEGGAADAAGDESAAADAGRGGSHDADGGDEESKDAHADALHPEPDADPPTEAGSGDAPDAVVVPGDAATETDACALYTHSDGVGQTWADCTPLSTYSQDEAAAACAAYLAAGGTGPCSDIPIPCGMQGATSVCAPAYCWVYEGSAAGEVLIGSGPSACTTPAGTWK